MPGVSEGFAALRRSGLPLLLASGSPRRSGLLIEAGIAPIIRPAAIEEVAPPHLTPGETTLWNARLKAREAGRADPRAITLAADTLVAHRGEILGKPPTRQAAFRMLRRLAGSTHEVFTGVWIERRAAGRCTGFIAASRVTFRELADEEIRRAHELTDPLDKAGAYAAQHDPLKIIRRIDGSRTNVIGLPMERLSAALAALLAPGR